MSFSNSLVDGAATGGSAFATGAFASALIAKMAGGDSPWAPLFVGGLAASSLCLLDDSTEFRTGAVFAAVVSAVIISSLNRIDRHQPAEFLQRCVIVLVIWNGANIITKNEAVALLIAAAVAYKL